MVSCLSTPQTVEAAGIRLASLFLELQDNAASVCPTDSRKEALQALLMTAQELARVIPATEIGGNVRKTQTLSVEQARKVEEVSQQVATVVRDGVSALRPALYGLHTFFLAELAYWSFNV